MGNFNRDRGDRRDRGSFDRGGSGRGFNRGDNRGGGGFSRPSMHQVVCDECGEKCEVPFKPSGDKPVYCSHCFGKKGHKTERPSRPSFDNRSAKPADDSKEKEILKAIKTLNYKVDQLMKVLIPEENDSKMELAVSPEEKEVKVKTKKAAKPKKTTTKKKTVKKKTTAKKTSPKKKAKKS